MTLVAGEGWAVVPSDDWCGAITVPAMSMDFALYAPGTYDCTLTSGERRIMVVDIDGRRSFVCLCGAKLLNCGCCSAVGRCWA